MSRNNGDPPPDHEVASEPFRVGVARFAMETCTFSPRPTGIEEWEHRGPPVRGDEVLEQGAYSRGFRKRTREVGDTELVGLPSPRWPLGGSSGSWVTEAAFEKYASGIADAAADADLDAVYLSLHGAMAVDGVPRPEAETVRRVREALGDGPIYVTLDLHANVDAELNAAADATFVVKRYPHYDAAYQGARAARILHRQLRGDYEPTVATREPGVVTPSVVQGTAESPAMEIMERARRWERRADDAFVSVAFGFAYADVPTAGATVMVVTDDDRDLAEEIAADVSGYVRERREEFASKARSIPGVDAGVARAIEAAEAGRTPVVLADHADRMGHGTHVLRALIEQGASRFAVATISDERAVEEIESAGGEGEEVTVDVGSEADEYAGDPVTIDGAVEYLGPYRSGRADYDRVAVLRFGDGDRVILTPTLHQVASPTIFEALGIDFEEVDIVAIKSRVHFRRGFVETGIADEVVRVDAPGRGPADLTELEYENVPAGLYPLSEP